MRREVRELLGVLGELVTVTGNRSRGVNARGQQHQRVPGVPVHLISAVLVPCAAAVGTTRLETAHLAALVERGDRDRRLTGQRCDRGSCWWSGQVVRR